MIAHGANGNTPMTDEPRWVSWDDLMSEGELHGTEPMIGRYEGWAFHESLPESFGRVLWRRVCRPFWRLVRILERDGAR